MDERTDTTSMTTTTIEVTGGVDTHRDTHHALGLDQVGRLLGAQEFPAEPAGYQQLLTWLVSRAPAATAPA
jgi:transposase